MKTLKYLGFALIGLFIFMACQKETSLETGFSGAGAVGYLGSVAGQCDSTTVISGEYVRDSVLNQTNYVTLRVNIVNPGIYKIITGTENGFSFYDSGYILNTGVQSIKLKAIGRPIAVKNTNFLVTFGESFCSFTVPVVDTPNTKAIFKISTNGCGILTTPGFRVGTPLNANTSTMTTRFDVTKAGTYNIRTRTRNGMYFSSVGSFFSVGLNQTVVLRGVGTPITAGKDTIFLIFGLDTACAYAINVDIDTTNNGTAADSAWQFKQGTSFYYGPVDSCKKDSITVITLSGPTKVPGVGVWGSSYATGDTAFFVGVPIDSLTGLIVPGTYNTNSLAKPAAFGFYQSGNLTNVYYSATFATALVGNMVVTVTSYDATTKIIKGTFAGTAAAGATPTAITAGKFTAKVQ